MNPWTLVYEGFEPKKEGLREALCPFRGLPGEEK